MFDLLNFIPHIKMLSELNTLTLFRVDTFTNCAVIWMYCKNWDYQRHLFSNFYSLNIKTTETTGLKNKNKVAMLLFKVLIFSPNFDGFLYFTELGFNSKYNTQHSSQKEAKGSNEQLFHLHTFKPGASGVRQTLNLKKKKKQ